MLEEMEMVCWLACSWPRREGVVSLGIYVTLPIPIVLIVQVLLASVMQSERLCCRRSRSCRRLVPS